MKTAADMLQKAHLQIDVQIDVFGIVNNFFGETVTVSGLITASDIISGMKDINLSEYGAALIPKVMLREFSDTFLDGITTDALSKTLGIQIVPTEVDGYLFLESVINI